MTNDTYRIGIELWRRWLEMWNGTPELALELVAPRFVLHVTPPSHTPEAEVVTPADVAAWVAKHRARFDKLTFLLECGPFVDTVAGVVAGPWNAEAVVGGAAQAVSGMDTIAFRDGRIIEYWTLSKPVDAWGRWGTAVTAGSTRTLPHARPGSTRGSDAG